MNKTLPNWRIDSVMELCAGEVPDAGRSGGRGGGKNKQELTRAVRVRERPSQAESTASARDCG